jgi:hypothetical protein
MHVLDLMVPIRNYIKSYPPLPKKNQFTLFSLLIVNLDKASINKSKYSSFIKTKLIYPTEYQGSPLLSVCCFQIIRYNVENENFSMSMMVD